MYGLPFADWFDYSQRAGWPGGGDSGQTPGSGNTGVHPAAPAPTATVDVSPNLRASDPSTVVLASGEPQLVEFFAFW